MAGVDAKASKLEVRDRCANDGGRAGAGASVSAALLSFSSETSAPDEFRPSMVWTAAGIIRRGLVERERESARERERERERASGGERVERSDR